MMNRIVNRIRDRMATGPEYAQQLRRLETEEATSRDIYNRFVEQYTGAQIRQAEQRAAALRQVEPLAVRMRPRNLDEFVGQLTNNMIDLFFCPNVDAARRMASCSGVFGRAIARK